MREAINFIWKLSIGAELAAAIRLLLEGLAGEYPALLSACCFLPIQSVLLMYSYSSAASQDQARQIEQLIAPIDWIVAAWLVFELFSRWTRGYRGIGRFGQLLLTGLLATALLISIACWHVEWQALVFRQSFRIYYILNRFVYATLALFVVGAGLFFRNYPVAIPPNVIRSTYIATVYFVVVALSYLVFTLTGLKVVPYANLAIVAAPTGCFLAWAVMLTRKGQVSPPVQHISPEDRERIERLNEELLAFMGEIPKRHL